MKPSELRGRTEQELRALLIDLRREQFAMRMQKGGGQSPRPSQVAAVRRDIARIKTILGEKQQGAAT